MSKIDRLCAQVGIRIIPTKRRRKLRETHARRALAKLSDRHGEGHVRFVLRAIVGSTNNGLELWSETIMALSDVVLARPDLADRGLAFMEAFDRIALADLRARARALGLGSKRQTMRVLIAERLEAELNPQAQDRLL